MVQGTNQGSISWQSCHLWAVRPGNNNVHLTGVNVSIETDEVCEGFGRPECRNKCVSLALQATTALGGRAGHTHTNLPGSASAACVEGPVLLTRSLRYFGVSLQGVFGFLPA